ncbi:flp pilus-assembly TadE/G-like family protein [Allokutzneria sp. A3M-2-11 16]|uniref:Rv3654c family TadE-like protein n=1 Tax=Allokutzneria sp. A3M-2-11 16 TaxID=2962043 RepID=UPI0020B7ADE1|nr:Rv3654c family TadE-like protein [Allokutzneria sp. A3M-2-11 16]MCP3799886.1 flp pilus-assembly TadE/G-like family protein [Allokutzneria sp. A3M-2-11 16]
MTVPAAMSVAGLLSVLALLIGLGSALVNRHRAEAAADLAALAAAGQATAGTAASCRAAERVGARMGVAVTSCRLDGWDALVEVRMTANGALPFVVPVVARARAGPAE